ELGHVLDEDGALEVPAVGLEEVLQGPVAVLQDAADGVVDLGGEVEGFGDEDLGAVELVQLAAQLVADLIDDADHHLVAVHALAGGQVQGDHLAGLELAAGDDGGAVQAEDAGLAGDVGPAAGVGEPADGAQAHAVHQAGHDAAVGGDDAGGAVPGAESAVGPAVVGEDVHGLLAPDVGLALPDGGGGQAQGAEQRALPLPDEGLQAPVAAGGV